jgi:hypothetical protein
VNVYACCVLLNGKLIWCACVRIDRREEYKLLIGKRKYIERIDCG